MEIIIVLAALFFIWLIFKIIGALFYTGAFLITLPIKIIFSLFVILLCIPLGIAAGLIGIIGIVIPLLPFLLIGGIIYLLLRHN
jgi:hypothetical protein